ncbi:hypothetical protein GEMRC1_012486 [Eukaryota sp. GEM-RC1]
MDSKYLYPVTLSANVDLQSTGVIHSTFAGYKISKTLTTLGKVEGEQILRLMNNSALVLKGGEVDLDGLYTHELASVTGFGDISSFLYNHGTLIPTGVLSVLDLYASSESALVINNKNEVPLTVHGHAYLNGKIELRFGFHELSINSLVPAIVFNSAILDYVHFTVHCDHYFDIVVGNNSVNDSVVNDYPGPISNLGQCPLHLPNGVSLVIPDDNSEHLLWSRTDFWIPSFPDESSVVDIDGFYINDVVYVDQSVSVESLYLSDIVLSIGCFSLSVTDLLSITDSSINCTCVSASTFSALNFKFLETVKFSHINFVLSGIGIIKESHLILDTSILTVNEDAVLILNQDSIDPSTLLAFGNGIDGKTGTGIQEHHKLLHVVSPHDFVEISTGSVHTLGITTDGSLYSWGGNVVEGLGTTGQLGVGDVTKAELPTKVDFSSAATSTSIVRASSGGAHSLVRTTIGDVYSFGSGAFGQLGLGSASNQLTPVKISSLANVVDVSAGQYHSLAVLDNGEVRVWGNNDNGQLGTNSNIGVNSPTKFIFTSSIKKVVACADHSLFISSDGQLFATGRNHRGQLCVGDSINRNTPTAIRNSEDYHVIDASCGPSHTAFLTSQDEVFTCGDNRGRSNDVPAHSPGKVQLENENIIKVEGRGNTVYVLSISGHVYSWTDSALPFLAAVTADSLFAEIYAGVDTVFLKQLTVTEISGIGNSLVEIEGALTFEYLSTTLTNLEILVKNTGNLTSIGALRFTGNTGSFSLVLEGGTIDSKLLSLSESTSLTGFGQIMSVVHNGGYLNLP